MGIESWKLGRCYISAKLIDLSHRAEVDSAPLNPLFVPLITIQLLLIEIPTCVRTKTRNRLDGDLLHGRLARQFTLSRLTHGGEVKERDFGGLELPGKICTSK